MDPVHCRTHFNDIGPDTARDLAMEARRARLAEEKQQLGRRVGMGGKVGGGGKVRAGGNGARMLMAREVEQARAQARPYPQEQQQLQHGRRGEEEKRERRNRAGRNSPLRAVGGRIERNRLAEGERARGGGATRAGIVRSKQAAAEERRGTLLSQVVNNDDYEEEGGEGIFFRRRRATDEEDWYAPQERRIAADEEEDEEDEQVMVAGATKVRPLAKRGRRKAAVEYVRGDDDYQGDNDDRVDGPSVRGAAYQAQRERAEEEMAERTINRRGFISNTQALRLR